MLSIGHFFNSKRIAFLLRCTWNILWDSSYLGCQITLEKFKKTEIISSVTSENNAIQEKNL